MVVKNVEKHAETLVLKIIVPLCCECKGKDKTKEGMKIPG